ncbi:MAG: HAD family phosphatase [Firmicutes bacterium]|nr:HAD family phosphatase [Bacillota bacterium]
MSIKLIALDLDGTTINNDRVISDRNRRALQKAADIGVNIVIATGRPYCALPKDVFELDAVRYVLTSNGASITDLREKKTFYENCISAYATEKAVELLR